MRDGIQPWSITDWSTAERQAYHYLTCVCLEMFYLEKMWLIDIKLYKGNININMAARNINYRVDDPFYRYKIPSLQVRHRRNKTFIDNLESVTKSLNRNKLILLSYLCQTLGCGKFKNGLNGCHSLSTLQTLLEGFIDSYILCDCVTKSWNIVI